MADKVKTMVPKLKANKVKIVENNTVDDEKFNCYECDFQTDSDMSLNKHTNLKHRRDQGAERTIQCFNCDEKISGHWSMMTHRKEMHANLTKPCTNFNNGKCNFSVEACWWRHVTEKKTLNENMLCRVCGKNFNNKSEMMSHRKKEHEQSCRTCNKFENGSC